MKFLRSRKILFNKKSIIISLIILVGLLAIILVIGKTRTSHPQNSMNLTKTDKLIEDARYKLNNDSNNPTRYTTLCQLYLQKVRENADTSNYEKCDELLKKAETIDPNNADVVSTKAAVAYGKHSFIEGLKLSQKAQQLNPGQVSYIGLVADGQIELGQYEEASKSIQLMVNRKPDLSSYNRVAYIREINGDIEGAKTALQSAISAGSSFPENTAYSQVELSKLYARSDLSKTDSTLQQALQAYSNFNPALEGLGKLAFAQKDYKKAEKYFKQASDSLPLAQYLNELGDTYSAMGDKTKADQQYYLAEVAFEKSSSGGVNNDYELSVFLTQQNKDNQKAIDLAKKAVEARPNIFSTDALAWALYQKGNYAEAQGYINDALVLGSNEPVIVYHAGMIAEKLGQNDQAKTYLKKASELDKYFLETHFSLLDRRNADQAMERLE